MSLQSVSSAEMKELITDNGRSVYDLSFEQPVLLVFLRHFGCIFCREAMKDIARLRSGIEADGNTIVLVHMESNELAEQYFQKFKLSGCRHLQDPECYWYSRFGLTKGSFSQLFGLKTMVRGFSAGFSMKQFGGGPLGDAFQMPGIFVIYRGVIQAEFIHSTVSDRPDYQGLLDCCVLE